MERKFVKFTDWENTPYTIRLNNPVVEGEIRLFTPRQVEVLEQLFSGVVRHEEIAQNLGMNTNTVPKHLAGSGSSPSGRGIFGNIEDHFDERPLCMAQAIWILLKNGVAEIVVNRLSSHE